MKYLNLLFFLLIISVGGIQAQTTGMKIMVSITNFSNDDGQAIVTLYNSEEHFLKEAFKRITQKIENGKLVVVFENIPEGDYTISVIHDENSSGKLDFSFIGKPSEDVASSNNAKGFMGPPKYKDAMFKVKDKPVLQNIKM